MKQTILITGTSTGLGRATAKFFAAQGWNVVATMRRPEAEAELTRLDDVLVTRLDVQDLASIAEAIRAGISRFGRIDAILNNAGFGVEPLAKFLNIPVWKTTKTLIYEADDKVVAVAVRGDCDVNEIKLANFIGCKRLRLASAETIKELTGAEVGYAGPIGLPASVRIIADRGVGNRVNFECGANKTNYHNINVNFGRDLPPPEYGEFKLAKAGERCPRCDGTLQAARGIEVGHIFELGTKYSEAMNCR